ncbi:glycoside hydrolase family 16 protein [Pedobacter africanus]|uniref:Beta-glucanase (GH16 family) n=1 Tax=Pedobacter africanus TaxID=151894 RepID=A0ACC6L1K9_9SPHI|nr:glycoside hydrolase family 16 protein [Pedobacter africanus]MDR6785376.1 beta-glucanase (GH16 family) [Pedobacter africanus]
MFRNILLIALTACFFSACKVKKTKTPAKSYTLVWADEFNYNGLPDSAKWGYDVGGDGWGNNELQYYTRADTSNAVVRDGKLFIIARKEAVGGKMFSSARLVTRDKAEWAYGKIEINAKLPAGRGLWPAAWMLGANIKDAGWPACGEIDIMEHVGYNRDSIFGTVHTAAYNHIKGTQKGVTAKIKDPYNSFHTYSIEWTPEKIDFMLDHKVYYSVSNENKTKAEWPFDDPFYLLLNIAVGGNLGGMKGVDEQVFPAVMEVDYVRVYK